VEDTISGPSVTYQVNPIVAARAGFTPDEVSTDALAILEGAPAATPVVRDGPRTPSASAFPRKIVPRLSA